MTKKTKEELELEEYLAGLTEKKARCNDNYIVNHDYAMKQLAVKRKTDVEWQTNQGKRIKADRNNPEKKEQWKQSLRDGWNKPGVRERKSASQKASYQADPELLKKKQDVARRNGRNCARPCYSPEGIFESSRIWAEVVGHSRDLFGYRARKMPDKYYYITKEEYTKLTGKDPWNE